jgi:proteasome-associated ATPase
LGDLILEVPRPDLRAARDILGKHLSAELPFSTTEHPDQIVARRDLIESLTTMVFAPNGLGTLATITFRDGTQRKVEPGELISGAILAKVAADARDRAAHRTIETGCDGILLEDLVIALTDELRQFAENLTPANCRQHLGGLPQHLDVVRVEPVRRKVVSAVRYLNAA